MIISSRFICLFQPFNIPLQAKKMANSQVQEQKMTTGLQQTQSITQRQFLLSQLTELPMTQLVDRINTEVNDNPALETDRRDNDYESNDSGDGDFAKEESGSEDFDSARDREDRQSALNDALANLGRDDEELPVYSRGYSYDDYSSRNESADTLSFYDQLHNQFSDVEISDRQRDILEYLIGSLDDDGLLRKRLSDLSDEMAVKLNIDASTMEIAEVLHILQQFDPAGVGARNLQECLLLQIDRRPDSKAKKIMHKIVAEKFDLFANRKWEQIGKSMKLSELQVEALKRELRKLNPRPGSSLGGNFTGGNAQQVTPDFIVDTSEDGIVSFTLNGNEVPVLRLSKSFVDSIRDYENSKGSMSRQVKEALLYTKSKVEAAQMFIDAVKERNQTLKATMSAIIRWQKDFFLDGDETSLRPMRLKDIANATGYDISTISRVCRSKYAQTRWGIFQLRYFFVDSFVTEGGEELSTKNARETLKNIIANEDGQAPLSDDEIKEEMDKRGYPIARRTVSKYREELGIPAARLRKK